MHARWSADFQQGECKIDREPASNARSRAIARAAKGAGYAGGSIRLVRDLTGLAAAIVLAVLLTSWGVPPWFGVLIVAAVASLVVLEIVGLKRTAAVNLESTAADMEDDAKTALEPGEEQVFFVPGVMRTMKTRGVAIAGVGKVQTPENTLLLTNQAVWALTVPMPGVDRVVSGTDIGKWQWLTAWRDIEANLGQLLHAYTLGETLAKCRAKKICSLDGIVYVKYSDLSQGINLKIRDSESYYYSVRDREMYRQAREALDSLLQNR